MDSQNSVSPTPTNEPQKAGGASPADESREVTVSFNANPKSGMPPTPQVPTPNTSMDAEVPTTPAGGSATPPPPPPPPIGPETQPANDPFAPQPTITGESPVTPASGAGQPFASAQPTPGTPPNMGFGGVQGSTPGAVPGTTPMHPTEQVGQPFGPSASKGSNKMAFIGLILIALVLIAGIVALLFLKK